MCARYGAKLFRHINSLDSQDMPTGKYYCPSEQTRLKGISLRPQSYGQ